MKLERIQGAKLVRQERLRPNTVAFYMTGYGGVKEIYTFNAVDKISILRAIFDKNHNSYSVDKIVAAANIYDRIQDQYKADMFIIESLTGGNDGAA